MSEPVAYLTCPDCMVPNAVSDEAVRYRCASCASEIVFERCTECAYDQAIPARWQAAFTCGRCLTRVPIPRARLYSSSAKAAGVQGYGYTYPKL